MVFEGEGADGRAGCGGVLKVNTDRLVCVEYNANISTAIYDDVFERKFVEEGRGHFINQKSFPKATKIHRTRRKGDCGRVDLKVGEGAACFEVLCCEVVAVSARFESAGVEKIEYAASANEELFPCAQELEEFWGEARGVK